jgi:hypothetical protein
MKLDAKDIIQKLKSNRKVKDYSLVIVFFLVFTVFLWFAIRPNLITAFSLQQELEELREKDTHYEEVIMSIVEFQTKLESNRDRLYLLDEAIPEEPQVHKMITDIRTAAEESDIGMTRLELRQVDLLADEDTSSSKKKSAKGNIPEKKEYIMTLNSDSSQEEVDRFVAAISKQRRLKLLNQVVFSPDRQGGNSSNSTESATLRVQFEIRGLYL